jgi:hypothetical protein
MNENRGKQAGDMNKTVYASPYEVIARQANAAVTFMMLQMQNGF